MDTKEPTCLGDYEFDKENCVCKKKPLQTILEEIDSPTQLKTLFTKPKDYEDFAKSFTKIGKKTGKSKTKKTNTATKINTATKQKTKKSTTKPKTMTKKKYNKI